MPFGQHGFYAPPGEAPLPYGKPGPMSPAERFMFETCGFLVRAAPTPTLGPRDGGARDPTQLQLTHPAAPMGDPGCCALCRGSARHDMTGDRTGRAVRCSRAR